MILASAWGALATSVLAVDDRMIPVEHAAPLLQVSNGPAIKLAADSARPVFIEFLASPRVTEELRTALTRAGYVMALDKAGAEVVYELDGAYQALRPASARSAEVRAGEYAEKPGPVVTKTGRSGSVMMSLNPIAMLIGTLMLNLGDMSGARDGVNAAVAGDPDGKCLAKCEGWIYRQRAVVSLTRIDGEHRVKASALATWQGRELVPDILLNHAAAALADATGVPLRTVFARAAP